MNVRELANRGTRIVNANTYIEIYRSNGYSVGAGRKQEPNYEMVANGYAQIQALDSIDLKHLDGLNIQGTMRALYLNGALAGVIRPDNKGGDIVKISSRTWLIVKVLETWPDWVKVVIQLQND